MIPSSFMLQATHLHGLLHDHMLQSSSHPYIINNMSSNNSKSMYHPKMLLHSGITSQDLTMMIISIEIVKSLCTTTKKATTIVVDHNNTIWFLIYSLIENPPSCNYVFNYCSIINQVEHYTYNCNLFFATRKYFLQLLTSTVKKYKSRVKL
jgi:hypothetical protein